MSFIEPAWGYTAVFGGMLIEGEVAYLSGILFSEVGRLSLWVVILLSFAASFLRDTGIFIFFRKGGRQYLKKNKKWGEKMESVGHWVFSRPFSLLVFYRFFYGTSTMIIVTLALSGMSLTRYAVMAGIGSFLWSSVYGLLGIFAAREVIAHIEWIQSHMPAILGILTGLLAIYLVLMKWKNRKIQ